MKTRTEKENETMASMTARRPRLIKKDTADAAATAKRQGSGKKAKRETVRRKVDLVIEWVERKSIERQDPRKAFAALFSQPQTS